MIVTGRDELYGGRQQIFDLLHKFETSVFDFHLTGSRLLGAVEGNTRWWTGSSDYDFFTVSIPAVEEFLKELDFDLLPKDHAYHRGGFLMEKLYGRNVLDTAIHIQLIPSDLTGIKCREQEFIRQSGLCHSLSKEGRRILWQIVEMAFLLDTGLDSDRLDSLWPTGK